MSNVPKNHSIFGPGSVHVVAPATNGFTTPPSARCKAIDAMIRLTRREIFINVIGPYTAIRGMRESFAGGYTARTRTRSDKSVKKGQRASRTKQAVLNEAVPIFLPRII